MDKMLEIETVATQLEEETNQILHNNFPMDSREFLTGEDLERVKSNDEKISSLAKLYLEAYKSLQPDEQGKYDYKNIQGIYYQKTHMSKGLKKAYANSDEYELHEAFSKASQFGMLALDGMFEANKNDDRDKFLKNQKVFQQCVSILNVHFWGKERIDSLNRYGQRLESGRTVNDDIRDYANLVQECKNISLEYAKANINGLNEEEKAKYFQIYDTIFKREKQLTEFIPNEVLNGIYVNLHWMKVDAERNPQKLIDEDMENDNKKHM